MKSCVLLALVAATHAFVLPSQLLDTAKNVPSQAATLGYAVDFSVAASTSTCNCLKQGGYSVIFARAYNPSGSGSFDSSCVTTIKNSNTYGLGVEVYITPQPKSSKNATQQFDEVYQGLTNNGIVVRSVWLQVTSPANWYVGATNVNFITAFINRGQRYGINVNIYTGYSDWNTITGNYTGIPSSYLLWYWNTYGSGVSNESPANYNDFRAIGNWRTPTAKQYGQVETLCSITVNRDVFTTGMPAPQADVQLNQGKLVVGGFIRHPEA